MVIKQGSCIFPISAGNLMIHLKERDPDMKTKTNALYEEVAGKMDHLIRHGTYRTGTESRRSGTSAAP